MAKINTIYCVGEKMFDVAFCNYHTPCGLCTYYNKPCSEICNPKKVVNKKKCSSFVVEYGKTVCYGTKEREECTCGGDESKCNFYKKEKE